MSSQLFEKAKAIGLSNVRAILPDGRQEGVEWIAQNPLRTTSDGSGAFRVNLDSGRWADFADGDARGNDVISLYAYLNEARLSSAAGRYKNYDGGLQAEAAKDILLSYDPTYFPSSEDSFIPDKKGGGDYWSGFHQIKGGLPDPPALDTEWYQGKWGSEVDRWRFQAKGKTVMIAVRFRSEDGKKEDRPFTLWTDGRETRWRAKAPEAKYPLWNADELEARGNDCVLLTEGQKAARVLKPVTTRYVCAGWYGGAGAPDKTDWEVLRGREVYFAFDGDTAGRKALAKIRSIAGEYDIKLHPVHPPAGVKKGWDLADAVADNWSAEQLYEHIEAQPHQEDNGFLDDDKLFFKILGYQGDQIVFYSYGSRLITRHKASAISKGILMSLMDRKHWGRYFEREDGGIAWDAAINYVLRQAEQKPVFDPAVVRGAGAWIDGPRMVINAGEYLLVDGQRRELHEAGGEFVYEKSRSVPYTTENPLPTDDARGLIEMLSLIDWKHPASPYIAAGWALLSPYGGALRWRSHVWITGRKGSGKSWILENIIYPLIGNSYGIKGYGTSTPAGVRDALGNGALASVMDEMESDNKKYAEYIDQNLKMFREGSSGTGHGAATLHGTSDGEGRQWLVKSMAMFASIGASLRHGADRSRFTLLDISGGGAITDIAEQERRFRELERYTEILTSEWVRAFHARTYKLFDEVQKCIRVMCDQAAEMLGNRRDADQLGTLFAGAWMIEHEAGATAAQARSYMESLEIEDLCRNTENKADEELCLDEIMSSRIEITPDDKPVRVSIGACLSQWYRAETGELKYYPEQQSHSNESLKRELEQWGLKPVAKESGYVLQVAAGHPALKRLLRDTTWSNIYDDMLARLQFSADEQRGPGRFAGIQKRYREIDMKELFDVIPF